MASKLADLSSVTNVKMEAIQEESPETRFAAPACSWWERHFPGDYISSTPCTSTLLDPEAFGHLAYALSLVAVGKTYALGFNEAMSRFVRFTTPSEILRRCSAALL